MDPLRPVTAGILLLTPAVLVTDLWVHTPDPSVARRVDDLDDVRTAFDDGRRGARLLVFLSSDQDRESLRRLLGEHSGAFTALAVWEGTPDLRGLDDPRVVPLWDPDHRVRDAAGTDGTALFRAGVRWEEPLPPADVAGDALSPILDRVHARLDHYPLSQL